MATYRRFTVRLARFGKLRVAPACNCLEDLASLQGRDRFDLITLWDVVEHLPNPHAFIRKAFQLLRPGGYLLIKTPRVSSFTFQMVQRYPRFTGILLQTPDHIQFFRRSTLSTLLQHNGFERIDWLKDRNMRSRPPTRSLRKTVSRFVIRVADRLGRNGNFYVMAQKP